MEQFGQAYRERLTPREFEPATLILIKKKKKEKPILKIVFF